MYIDEYFAIDKKVRATAFPIISTFGHMMIATSTKDQKLDRNELAQYRKKRNERTGQPILNLQEVDYMCGICKAALRRGENVACDHNPVQPMWIDAGEKTENIASMIHIVTGNETFAAAEMSNADVKTQVDNFKHLELPTAENAIWWVDLGSAASSRIFAVTDPSEQGDSNFVTTFIAEFSYSVSSMQTVVQTHTIYVVSSHSLTSFVLTFVK